MNSNLLFYVVAGGFTMWLAMFLDERVLKNKKDNKTYIKNILVTMLIVFVLFSITNTNLNTNDYNFLTDLNETIMIGKPNF
jgi:hypothetical protein